MARMKLFKVNIVCNGVEYNLSIKGHSKESKELYVLKHYKDLKSPIKKVNMTEITES